MLIHIKDSSLSDIAMITHGFETGIHTSIRRDIEDSLSIVRSKYQIIELVECLSAYADTLTHTLTHTHTYTHTYI